MAPLNPEQPVGLSPQSPFPPETQPREMLLSGDSRPAEARLLAPLPSLALRAQSRVQPQAAVCSGPGLFLTASAPHFVLMVLRRMS